MQSLPENAKFLCADCKAQFNSAALLLNHFSRHIYMLEKLEAPFKNVYQHGEDSAIINKNSHSMIRSKESKSESILEQVLRQSLLDVSSCDSNLLETSSSNSDYDNDPCSSEHESQIPLPVIEIGRRNSSGANSPSDVMLAKFDLQQRLENCILNLASKKDTFVESDNLPKSTESIQISSVTSTKNNSDHDDFYPLTYCLVTMEEGEENIELDASKTEVKVKPISKMSSNRKQRTPRKIPSVENAEVKIEVVDGKERDVTLTRMSKKKYPCNVCWKVFGWSTDLKRHILTHTGERPFKCQQCNATFTRNFLLQKHEMKTHQGQSSICKVPADLPSNCFLMNSEIDMKLEPHEPTISEFDAKIESIIDTSLKRKKKKQRLWNKKQMVCKSIELERFTQKALNIS